MKNRARNLLLAFALLTFLNIQSSITHAQGTAFTYEGQLIENGSPATGLYDFVFNLYTVSSGGSALNVTVTDYAVGVTNGVFLVTLDFGPDVFTGPSYWLEISVEPNGAGPFVTLSPRQQLTPTPYAIFAENSGGVNNASVSAPQLNTAGSPSAGQVLEFSGSSLVWATPPGGSGGWSLTGNAHTTPGVNFLGTTDNNALQLWVDNTIALQLLPGGGNPSLVGGYGSIDPSVGAANIDGGYGNSIAANADASAIGGGGNNLILNSATFSTIGGGYYNSNAANYSVVGGGYENSILTNAPYSAIAGGAYNQAGGAGAFVGGGGYDGTSPGGNIAIGNAATVGGGFGNHAVGNYSTVPGGYQNHALGNYSFAGGENATATYDGSFVWSGSPVGASDSDVGSGSFVVTAFGGIEMSTLEAESMDLELFQSASLNASDCHLLLDEINDSANLSSDGNVILNAGGNVTLDAGGGVVISDDTPSISFGTTTRQMLNLYGTDYGIGVQTDDEYFRTGGEFWWYNGGTNNSDFGNPGGGTALMRLGSSGSLIIAGTFTANGGILLTSDRNLKENFKPVDCQAVLARVASLPVTEWNYKTESKASQHIGPMAQDFQATFGLDGADDKHISVVDEGGVALAAIQGLNEKLEEKDKELQAQSDRIQQLQQSVAQLQTMVSELAGRQPK